MDEVEKNANKHVKQLNYLVNIDCFSMIRNVYVFCFKFEERFGFVCLALVLPWNRRPENFHSELI